MAVRLFLGKFYNLKNGYCAQSLTKWGSNFILNLMLLTMEVDNYRIQS
jgi:hypothetical protein